MSEFAEGYAVGVGNNQGNGCCYPMYGMPFGWGGMGWGGMGMGGFGGGWGGDWLAIIILFALLGNGGWGGNGYGNNQLGYELGRVATTNDVASGFSTSTIMSNQRETQLSQQQGFADVQQTLCQGFSGVNASVNNGFGDLSRQLAACCCDIERGIDGVNYNLASQACDIKQTINNSTRDIIDSQRCGTDRILGFLTNEKISSLEAANAALTAQLSQNAQTRTLIDTLRPTAVPAYITCSPYQSAYGFGGYGFNGFNNGCGCGCGC